MSISLRDQLAQLGFKPAAVEKPAPSNRSARPHPGKPNAERARDTRSAGKPAPTARPRPERSDHSKTSRSPRPARPARSSEMDLGKAYALRAQKEKDDRIAAEKAKQEAARVKREARAALALFLRGKGLNDPNAELTRHFEYGGKIKRIHVNAEQLKALNAGELGVVQNEGRYLLVHAAVLDEATALFADAVALRVDPNAQAKDDPYADPQYQVPDDLVW